MSSIGLKLTLRSFGIISIKSGFSDACISLACFSISATNCFIRSWIINIVKTAYIYAVTNLRGQDQGRSWSRVHNPYLNFSFHIFFLLSFMFNNFFIMFHDFFLFLRWGWSFWRPFFGINHIPCSNKWFKIMIAIDYQIPWIHFTHYWAQQIHFLQSKQSKRWMLSTSNW